MASEFYLVLPSNSSMVMHPNNTLAQYITNIPRRISLSGDWECGLTEIDYPHNWYNVRNARLTVEHDGNVETDVCFEDGYYDNPKALATMRGRWVGHCPILPALVSRGGTGLEVCSVVSSERLPL